jgi:hypothetical protein
MKKTKNLFFILSIYRSYLLKRGHHLYHFCEEGKFGREMKFEFSGFQKYLKFLAILNLNLPIPSANNTYLLLGAEVYQAM